MSNSPISCRSRDDHRLLRSAEIAHPGYASLDYSLVGYQERIGQARYPGQRRPVDALSLIMHREKAYGRADSLAERLKELSPATLRGAHPGGYWGKVIARETVKALRKDVLAKCYGGDITRKRKLLEKQKEGKKRMKRVGNVEIPQEAFMAV